MNDYPQPREDGAKVRQDPSGSKELLDTPPENVAVFCYVQNVTRRRILYVGPAYQDIFGRSCQSLFDDPGSFLEAVHPEDREQVKAALGPGFLPDRHAVEYRIIRPDGAVRHLLARPFPVLNQPGKTDRRGGIVEDITGRKEADHALRTRADHYRLLADNATDLISQHLPGGTFAYASPACRTLLGYEPDELVGRSVLDLVHPDDVTLARRKYAAASLLPELATISGRIRRKDGSLVWVETTLRRLLHGRTGAVNEVVAVTRDISERRRAEERLDESEVFGRSVLNSLSAHIAVLDRQGDILAVNDAWQRFARANGGDTATTLGVGTNYLHACRRAARPADEVQATLAGIQEVLDGKLPLHTADYPCHSPDDQRWFSMSVTPLSGARGGAVIAHTDITERYRAAAARRRLLGEMFSAQEEERRRIARDLHDGIGQSLTTLLLALGQVASAASIEAAQSLASESRSIALNTVDECRRLARGLRPPLLDHLGLTAALQRICADCMRSQDTVVRFRSDGPADSLPPMVEITLYRIAQEALANAVKHAKPRNISIALSLKPASVDLEVSDDGRGFDLAFTRKAGNGFGLSSMEERLTLLGGRLNVESCPGSGTTVRARLALGDTRGES